MPLHNRYFYANQRYSTYKEHIAAPMLRRSFALPRAEKVTLAVVGLGFYRLFLNGRDITRGELAPYIANPDHYVYMDEYDVTNLLVDGENVVGLILGNGLQNTDLPYWSYRHNTFRSAPKFAFSMMADGEELFDAESFCWSPSPYTFDDMRSGVFYDATKEQAGWCMPDFDDSRWQPVSPAERVRGVMRRKVSPNVEIYDDIQPRSIKAGSLNPDYRHDGQHPDYDREGPYAEEWQDKENGFVYDFGINTSALYRLRIKGERGQKVSLQFCEFLDDQGRPDYRNVNFYPDGYAQRDIYICAGDGVEEFVPAFTYHGYRYVYVSGITAEQATEDLLTMLPISNKMNALGDFSCSDGVLNALQSMTVNSDLSNAIHIITDCPTREKMGWTGDVTVSAEHMILNLDMVSTWREWLYNIRAAQRENGGIPCIVPTGHWGYGWGSGPIWDNVLFELPYMAYVYRGDDTLAKENATAMFRYLHYAATKIEADGLVEYGLGDWVQADVRGYDRKGHSTAKAPRRFVDSCALYDACRKAQKLFAVLGKTLEEQYAAALADGLLSALRTHCIDHATATAWGRCQTSQACAMVLGIFEPAELAAAGCVLKQLVHEAGNGIDCGFYGLRYLFHALSMVGLDDLAYAVITRDAHPSYKWFVDQGATAMPENFSRRKRDSYNHHFLCDCSHWFYRWVAGLHVNPHGDDVNRVDLRPRFLMALTQATAHYNVPKGRVAISWQREDADTVWVDITVPEGVCVWFHAPAGYAVDSVEDNKVDGLRSLLVTGEVRWCLRRVI